MKSERTRRITPRGVENQPLPYSSMGPELRGIERDGNELVVSTSPVEEVYLTGFGTRHKYIQRSSMTETRLPLDLFNDSWAQVIVVDRAGQRAWSNPFEVATLNKRKTDVQTKTPRRILPRFFEPD
ncbi:MAG: hypothetical protein R2843_13235 [Thermomicrobiales bacterium]